MIDAFDSALAPTAVASVPVLIVDDNPAKRLSLRTALGPLGYRIDEAVSGWEALRRLMVRDYAVILLDVRMPTMDGYETAGLIRQRRESEMTPIIFVTGHAREDVVPAERWAGGAVDFIFSPVPPEELRAKVSVFANLYLRAEALAAQAREVQTSADHLRLLTDAAPIGIFQTDPDNRYIYTNPRWTVITGIGSDEAMGRDWDSIFGVDGPTDLAESGNRGGVDRELSRRFEIGPPDGTSRVVLVTSKAIPDVHGGIAGWVGTLADVTIEALAETAMSDARDRATEASRLKSDFLANMSHEIRTPMNGVIGMTDLLLETDLDARQRDYAQTLHTSGQALLTIINDILDFSKVEAGRLEVETIEFDLVTVIEDVVDLLSGPAETKGLELIAVVDRAIPAVVRGDPGRVRQVLTNLIGNAIKFTRVGEIVVRVDRLDAVGADTVVRFEVSDTGLGITPDKLASIFEPFVQADTSTSRKYGGTGLGLAISVQLVALMGGECGVSSELGTGSVFWFTISVHTDAAPVSLPHPSEAGLSGLVALVVDDNATQRATVSSYLTDWGLSVRRASSGREARLALDEAATAGKPIAIAVVDQSLLAEGGLGAAFTGPAVATRLVAMTRLRDQRTINGAVATAGYQTLTKPIHRDRLLRALHAALDPQSPRGDRPPGEAAPPRPLAPDTDPGAPVATILVTEDNVVNQKVVTAMLSNWGYRVDIASDGEEAVRAFTAVSYDAIIMDCQMPVMDGYEATRAIRTAEGTGRRTPIIALTAAAMVDEQQRCLAVGMDDFLTKPINRQQLHAAIQKWIGYSAPASSQT